MREIRVLKQLKHSNIVNLIEVFRWRGKIFLVFEYLPKTILEELESHPYGMDPIQVYIYICMYVLGEKVHVSTDQGDGIHSFSQRISCLIYIYIYIIQLYIDNPPRHQAREFTDFDARSSKDM